jgi:DNA-binding CsgD family transcriptional regulator
MKNLFEQLEENLRSRLSKLNLRQTETVIIWLLAQEREKLATLAPEDLKIKAQGFYFRCKLLENHYLHLNPDRAYRNLIIRLSSLISIRQKIQTWLSQSRDQQRAIGDVIQEVIQEILKNDRYIQEQIKWIGQCTSDKYLRNILMLVTLEEYCLRPIRNQPLLLCRFVNFLRSQERGGLTQVPRNDIIRLISEELESEDQESPLSLFDVKAIARSEDQQKWEEQQILRQQVQEELESYLAEKLGSEAVMWLKLYLQGHSQETIAKIMKVPVKQIYRLREKINYHTLKGFAIKIKPELVSNWLEISLREHNFGLTKQQWESYWQKLTPVQQKIVNYLREGQQIGEIAKKINLKNNQIKAEWTNIYLIAQEQRNNYQLDK